MTADTRFDHAFKKTCKLISKIVELFLTDCNNIDLQKFKKICGHKFTKLFKILVYVQFATSKVVLDI